jgi:hypothetical protein
MNFWMQWQQENLWIKVVLAVKFKFIANQLKCVSENNDNLFLASKLVATRVFDCIEIKYFINYFYEDDGSNKLFDLFSKSWLKLVESIPGQRMVLFYGIMHALNKDGKLLNFLQAQDLALKHDSTLRTFMPFYKASVAKHKGIISFETRQSIYKKAQSLSFSDNDLIGVNNANKFCSKVFANILSC